MNKIFLTGFMGAGKTTVGRELARNLRWPFLDLDEEVERERGCTVREIFEREGEPIFRQLERRALEACLHRDRTVVAVGGGTFASPENLDLVRRTGWIVWIKPEFSVMARRIVGGAKADRPLFRNEQAAWELYVSRLPSYRQADLTVEVAQNETPAEVAARIALQLRERRCIS